ncbi:hypothetical protein BJ944DRAFT_188094 [Cunninghamella echinulata]|nr:hypothetical protein BJ944DRAFT_188094 [Cunninghamella echinulata]
MEENEQIPVDTSSSSSSSSNKKQKNKQKNKKKNKIITSNTCTNTNKTTTKQTKIQHKINNNETSRTNINNNKDIDMEFNVNEINVKNKLLNMEGVYPEEIPTPMDQGEAEDIPKNDYDNSEASGLDTRDWEAGKKNLIRDPESVSTFKSVNVKHFKHKGEKCVCIGLKKSEELVFVGYALIGTLFGSVIINGAIISSKENKPSTLNQSLEPWETVSLYPVFSPRTSSLMRVQSIPYEKTLIPSSSSASFDITFYDVGQLMKLFESNWQEFESVIIVKNLEWCGMNDLQDTFSIFGNLYEISNNKPNYFKRKDKFKTDRHHHDSTATLPNFIPITKTTNGARAIQIQPSWSSALDQLIDYEKEYSTPSISVVCGGGNVGKSSFCRYMINRLLNTHQRVAYLETDVGQSEFAPSGLVTLHIIDSPILGPPFTHSHFQSIRSYFIGHSTPEKNPDYYLTCISELKNAFYDERDIWEKDIKQQQQQQQQQHESISTEFMLPLIVNTHGWIKGLGYDLILEIINDIAPTHVFSFKSAQLHEHHGRQLPSEFYDTVINGQHYQQERKIVYLQTVDMDAQASPPVSWADAYLASDLRHFMFLSYIDGDDKTSNEFDGQWWNASPRLIARRPRIIDWTSKQFNGVWILYDEVPLSEMLYALNGSVIPPKYFSSFNSSPPDPSTTTCYGLGIIRSINPKQRQMYVLTPVSGSLLRKVTSIVKGNIELPMQAMLDKRSDTRYGIAKVPYRNVPYLTEDRPQGLGGGVTRYRNNLMRKSQIEKK